MDWSQWAIAGFLGLACYTGRPAPIVWIVMWGNFAASVVLHRDPGDVATADLVSFILLLGSANTVAAFFLAMQPIYVAGYYLGLNEMQIFTIIDLLALCQFAVIGGWDDGIGRLRRRYFKPRPPVGFVHAYRFGLGRRGNCSLGDRSNAKGDIGETMQFFSEGSGRG